MKFLRIFAALLLAASAQAVSFGSLNIKPRGAQNLNLETGATDMPQGGTATDSSHGLSLSAGKMQLKPGVSLSAQGATIKTRGGGIVNASQVVYDLKAGTVTATGKVNYSDARVSGLSASGIVLHVKSGFVVAQGGVKASRPQLSGSRFVFDPDTMQAVLVGPYRFGASSAGAGAKLLLTFAGNQLIRQSAAPSSGDLARFSPYLK